MTKQVWFAHGKESGPWGRKIRALAPIAETHGFEVRSPDYRHTMDPQERVRYLQDQGPAADLLVLVGSSMGGYVSAAASAALRPTGLFLLAPAVGLPGYQPDPEPRAALIEIVHGWDDALIPPDNVARFARAHDARLHLIPGEHTLNEQLPWLEQAFDRFLTEIASMRSPA